MISADAPEQTVELLAALAPLEGDWWPRLLEAPIISEVLEFGETLHVLATEYSSPRLLRYAQKLVGQANAFELTEMESSLHDFPKVASALRQSTDTPLAELLPA